MLDVNKINWDKLTKKAAAQARAETRRHNRILSGEIFTTSTTF